MEGTEIPVIDISPLAGLPDAADAEAVACVTRAMRRACVEVGFMYVKGHGVPEELCRDMLAAAERFFDSHQSLKDAVDARKSPLFRGYNSLEEGAHSCTPERQNRDGGGVPSRDLKESFTLGMERAAGDPRPASPMHGVNQWPALPGWRPVVERYLSAMFAAFSLVMRGLALSLDVEYDFFEPRTDDATAQLVLFKYPPSSSASDGQERGCGEHTDCGFLTGVLQNDVQGLEVRTVTGEWVQAKPVPGCLIVNLGDLMQRWSGGLFRSTRHRVHSPSHHEGPRLSVAFFLNANFDARVECIPQQRRQALALDPAFAPITAGHYMLQRLGLMWRQEEDQQQDSLEGQASGCTKN